MCRLLFTLAVLAAAVALVWVVMERWRASQPHPLAGMPPVVHRENLYSEAGAGHFSPATAGALPRVYVPAV
jgi:hypothetical protein